jgi:hypothetical protein
MTGDRVTGATVGFRIVADGADVDSEPPIEMPPARFAAGAVAGATGAKATGATTGDLRAIVTVIAGGAAVSMLRRASLLPSRAGGITAVCFSLPAFLTGLAVYSGP